MSRLLAVSYKPYRKHQLELRDAGRSGCAVVIHPPGGRGAPQTLGGEGEGAGLPALVARAKAMVDAVLGPRPPVTSLGRQRLG